MMVAWACEAVRIGATVLSGLVRILQNLRLVVSVRIRVCGSLMV